MSREKWIGEISDLFIEIRRRVDLKNGAGLFDINKFLEDIFRKTLNITYSLDLKPLNTRFNFPAIDLADYVKATSFQVTTTNSIEKVKRCVSVFESHKLSRYFSKLRILIVNDKVSYQKLPTLKGVDIDVLFLDELLSDIKSLDPAEIKLIRDSLSMELGRPVHEPISPFIVGDNDPSFIKLDDYFASSFFSSLDSQFVMETCHLVKELHRNPRSASSRLIFSMSLNQIDIEIFGAEFDPRDLLVHPNGKGGKMTLENYVKRYGAYFKMYYTYSAAGNFGTFSFVFDSILTEIVPIDPCYLDTMDKIDRDLNRSYCGRVVYDFLNDRRLAFLNYSDWLKYLIPHLDKSVLHSDIHIIYKKNDYRFSRIQNELDLLYPGKVTYEER